MSDPSDEIAVRVATQQFQLLQAAYETLSDAAKRRSYDESLGVQAPKRPKTARASWVQGLARCLRVPGEVSSLGAAVDQLCAEGGTIEVAGGCYEGLVVVSKPRVRIHCTERAVLRGRVVFRECATGSELRNLEVRGACNGGAVDLKGVKGDVSIEDCEISNELSAGVVLEGCAGHVSIKNTSIHDCKFDGVGLHLLRGDTASMGSLTLEHCVVQRNGYDGLYLGDPRYKVLLRGCQVRLNKRHGVLARGSELLLEDSVVEENEEEGVRREDFVHKQVPRGTQRANKPREVVSDLPEGWRAFRNTEGLTYYYHMQSGVTRWSLPGSGEVEKPALEAPSKRASKWS